MGDIELLSDTNVFSFLLKFELVAPIQNWFV